MCRMYSQLISLDVQTILGRRLIVGEIYELMNKVAELSVTAESEHVRQQSRQVGGHMITGVIIM